MENSEFFEIVNNNNHQATRRPKKTREYTPRFIHFYTTAFFFSLTDSDRRRRTKISHITMGQQFSGDSAVVPIESLFHHLRYCFLDLNEIFLCTHTHTQTLKRPRTSVVQNELSSFSFFLTSRVYLLYHYHTAATTQRTIIRHLFCNENRKYIYKNTKLTDEIEKRKLKKKKKTLCQNGVIIIGRTDSLEYS